MFRIVFLFSILFFLTNISFAQKDGNKFSLPKAKLSDIGVGFKSIGNFSGLNVTFKNIFYSGSSAEALVLPFNHNNSFLLGVKYNHQVVKTISPVNAIDLLIYVDGLVGIINTSFKENSLFYPVVNFGGGIEFLFIDRIGVQLELGIGNVINNNQPIFGFNGGIGINYYFKLNN